MRLLRRPRRALLRTRVMVGVPLVALAAFDVAGVTAAHGGTAQARPGQPHGLQVTLTLPAASPTTTDLAS